MLSQIPGVEYVLVFENRGSDVGVTLHHPHGQIYAYPFIPPKPRRSLDAAARYRSAHDKCLFCDVLDAELEDGRRIVAETTNFVAYVPSAARWPYEIHIQPRKHVADLADLSREERGELLRLQADVTAAFDGLFGEQIPYLSTVFQAPVHEIARPRSSPHRGGLAKEGAGKAEVSGLQRICSRGLHQRRRPGDEPRHVCGPRGRLVATRIRPMAEKVRVGVVGTGEWWGREHARLFSRRSDTELVAVVGRTKEKTESRAAEFGTTPYLDLHQMLEEQDPDLVSLCLPNEHHFETTMQTIEAGFPLLVEKPFVFDLEESERLLAEAEQRSLFFAINFNHRYAVPVIRSRAAIENGDLGEIVFATWRFGGEPGTSEHPQANLIETQCHGFDMIEHLCGPIESVMAQMIDNLTGHGNSTMAIALQVRQRCGGKPGRQL